MNEIFLFCNTLYMENISPIYAKMMQKSNKKAATLAYVKKKQ